MCPQLVCLYVAMANYSVTKTPSQWSWIEGGKSMSYFTMHALPLHVAGWRQEVSFAQAQEQ